MKIFGIEIRRSVIQNVEDKPVNPSKPIDIPPTSARKSRPDFKSTIYDLKTGLEFVNSGYICEVIPTIRKLSWVNADLGLALNDMVQLTNTGHTIKFDQKIPPEQRDLMKRHLKEASKKWGDGVNGVEGLINKMISQIWIGGALSTEWIISNKKDGVKNCVLVNPETILFAWVKSKQRFIPYQKQNGPEGEKKVKLSEYTYKYMSLNGDTEIPYGIPPYLTALSNLDVQGSMDKNIGFIMDQLGLLGFFETKVEKPIMKDGSTDEKYKAELKKYLDEVKTSVSAGMKDGTIIGFKDDHEFEFHAVAKNLSGAADLYKNNEIKVANGLKTAPEFIGFPTGGSESGMSIIFTKMLSQLVNVQNLLKTNLQFGYMLELTLAGFRNVTLEVEFKPSTITDELKFQQGQEIKIRNVAAKYNMGIIGQQQASEELGYDKPDESEPRAPIDDTAEKKQKRESGKDASDRKVRDKGKTQPKRKDTDTRTR